MVKKNQTNWNPGAGGFSCVSMSCLSPKSCTFALDMCENENAYVRLVQYILPPNLGKRFELVDVSDGKIGDELVLQ